MRGERTQPPVMMSDCATRAPFANPLPRVLRFASLRYGNDSQCQGAPGSRPTVAPRSLRSLVRPHHSDGSPALALRPLWLRCARVSQPDITTGHTVPLDRPLNWRTS